MTQPLQSPVSRRSPLPPRSVRSATEVQSWSRYPDRPYAWQVAASLQKSFIYAWEGLSYAFHTQRNFRLHTIAGTIAIALAFYLQFRLEQIAILLLTIGFVVGAELLNTAIESVVDLTVQNSYHELAKIAKDCAAGAVLVSAFVSIGVGLLLFIPAIWLRWQVLF